MLLIVTLLREKVLDLLRGERAQDTFEYLLIIGGISVVIIAAVALATPGLIGGVIDGVCAAINGVMPITC